MACTIIAKKCVNCEMCEPDCPQGAISFDGTTFVINKDLCTECKDVYPTPKCISVCPVHCVKRDSELNINKGKKK